jgi:hypothetical protein
MDDVRTRIKEEATEMERRWARSSERRTGCGRRLSSTAGRGGRSMEPAVDVAVIDAGDERPVGPAGRDPGACERVAADLRADVVLGTHGSMGSPRMTRA